MSVTTWMANPAGNGYGVAWVAGERTASVVTTLPEHSPDGSLVTVGMIKDDRLLSGDLGAMLASLPDVLADWQAFDRERYDAFSRLVDINSDHGDREHSQAVAVTRQDLRLFGTPELDADRWEAQYRASHSL